jgi:hypothetical protein
MNEANLEDGKSENDLKKNSYADRRPANGFSVSREQIGDGRQKDNASKATENIHQRVEGLGRRN